MLMLQVGAAGGRKGPARPLPPAKLRADPGPKPSKKLKAFFWDVLPESRVPGTFWAANGPTYNSLDTQEVPHAFLQMYLTQCLAGSCSAPVPLCSVGAWQLDAAVCTLGACLQRLPVTSASFTVKAGDSAACPPCHVCDRWGSKGPCCPKQHVSQCLWAPHQK